MTMADRGTLSVTPDSDDADGWLRFVAETRALVGDRDPLALMAAAPSRVEHALIGASSEQLRAPESAQQWSMAQVLAHLADVEMAWGIRLRQILTVTDYVMDGFDQADWAARLPYATWDAGESLSLFIMQRRRNLTVWRSLSDAEWQREARHTHRPGGESLRSIAQLIAGHDLRHDAQLARIRRTLGIQPSPVE